MCDTVNTVRGCYGAAISRHYEKRSSHTSSTSTSTIHDTVQHHWHWSVPVACLLPSLSTNVHFPFSPIGHWPFFPIFIRCQHEMFYELTLSAISIIFWPFLVFHNIFNFSTKARLWRVIVCILRTAPLLQDIQTLDIQTLTVPWLLVTLLYHHQSLTPTLGTWSQKNRGRP